MTLKDILLGKTKQELKLEKQKKMALKHLLLKEDNFDIDEKISFLLDKNLNLFGTCCI